jgi:single-stranded-DNA-specific exonuclease
MMPLLGENRSLVQRGLKVINNTPRVGIEALMLQSDLRAGMVDATAISFRLAPRLNAAGRLGDAKLAYRLLRTHDATEAHTLAAALNSFNDRRRTLTEIAQRAAEAQLAVVMADDPAIFIVGSEHFEHGIVGLVAGRLTDRYYRPAVVMRHEEDEARGSARSIPEFNISHALDEVGHLLIRHGGHQRAAGFTVRRAQLPAFQEALLALANQSLADRATLRPTIEVDAITSLETINWGVVEQFARLEPTGQENSPPTLLARKVRVRGVRTVGAGKHLRLVVDAGANGPVFDAVAFQQGEWAAELNEGKRIDIIFQVEINEWQGNRRLQLNVQDLRHSLP